MAKKPEPKPEPVSELDQLRQQVSDLSREILWLRGWKAAAELHVTKGIASDEAGS